MEVHWLVDLGSEHGISIGHEAGMCDSGSCNIALGKSALGGDVVTGNDNISVGRNSGGCLTSGAYNIFFGRDVASGGGTVTGANNIILGNCTGYSITNASHNIILGHTAANSATLVVAAGSNNIVMGCRNWLILLVHLVLVMLFWALVVQEV